MKKKKVEYYQLFKGQITLELINKNVSQQVITEINNLLINASRKNGNLKNIMKAVINFTKKEEKFGFLNTKITNHQRKVSNLKRGYIGGKKPVKKTSTKKSTTTKKPTTKKPVKKTTTKKSTTTKKPVKKPVKKTTTKKSTTKK